MSLSCYRLIIIALILFKLKYIIKDNILNIIFRFKK